VDHNNDPTVLAGSDNLTGKAIGRFQITALIGRGGMGEVYLAEDSLLKRPVALKRVSASLRANPHYRELLIKEAERASRLNDEHVARIHDVLEYQGEVFLVMEYVEGQSLRNLIRQPLPLSEFVPIAVQCVEALVAAHQSGIVHRDIKPENIMVSTKGRVKICDFGLARQNQWVADTGVLDRTPTVGLRGTPAYMAPEALLNRNPDFRADMFSLGIVFYEMLTGKHPFRDGDNQISTVDRIIHSDQIPVIEIEPSIPKTISTMIAKMLSKEPSARYDSPADLLAVLRSLPNSFPVVRRKLPTRYLIGIASLSVLVALILVLIALDPGTGNSLSPHRNLVVLPFRAIGETAEAKSYSDGFTDTITRRLSQLAVAPNFAVAPASEVRAKRVSTAEEARKFLAADVILEGTLYQTNSESRFIYSLYEAATLRHLASDTIAIQSSNFSAIEDRILTGVTKALEIPSDSGANEVVSKDRTPVVEAYDLYVQGRGYFQDPTDNDRLQIAMQAFERAKDLDPRYATAYASLGEVYWAKYQATKEAVWVGLARESCEKADALNPRSAAAKICLGTVNLGSGQFERSIGDFQNALEIEPGNDAAHLGLAGGYERTQNYEAAEKTFQQAIRLKPNFYLGHMRLGQFYIRRGRYADAADEFQKEIILIPNSDSAYLRIGAAYIYLNRYADAITVLRKAIELRPTAASYNNLGSSYFGLRRFDDAVVALEQAVTIFPRNFVIIGNLGRAYFWSTNQRPKAAAAYGRAIELGLEDLSINPRNSDAHILLSRYYAMLGRRTEALNHMTHALTLRPGDAEYFSISAVVHNQFGNRQEALAALKKALSLGWSVTSIKNEIEFDNLRTDPEFRKLTEG
jgi:serine/threonine-protein kinase